jgi:aminoethylphosphonate catabolism LysR family transcriptional regulator
VAFNPGQLRAFEAVARTGSFSRAAQELSVTQPAVTVQVRQLERQCGVRLFDRVGRRVLLTEPGRTLLQYAQRIFLLAGEAEEALGLARGLKAGRLRVIASLTSAAYYLPPLLSAFKRRYPEIQVQVAADNSRRVAERILGLEDDLGVLTGEPRHPSLVLEPFCEDPLVLILPPQHPWARRRSVSLRELGDQPLILREPGSATRALIEQRMAEEGVPLRVVMELASNEAIKRSVEMGNGLALISAAIARREVEGGYLAILRVREPGLVRQFHLIYHRERREAPLLKAVLEIARGLPGRRVRRAAPPAEAP